MTRIRVLLLLLIVDVAVGQSVTPAGKPCIAFSPGSDSSGSDVLAKDPLATAVTLSGDFEFYPNDHDACWTVHVLSLPVRLESGMPIGYAISYTVTDPHMLQIAHALQF